MLKMALYVYGKSDYDNVNQAKSWFKLIVEFEATEHAVYSSFFSSFFLLRQPKKLSIQSGWQNQLRKMQELWHSA